jgi:hypothetical protein
VSPAAAGVSYDCNIDQILTQMTKRGHLFWTDTSHLKNTSFINQLANGLADIKSGILFNIKMGRNPSILEFVHNNEVKTFLDSVSKMYKFGGQAWESATLKIPSASIQSHYRQNPIAVKWKVYSAGKLEDHIDRWRKWMKLQKTK